MNIRKKDNSEIFNIFRREKNGDLVVKDKELSSKFQGVISIVVKQIIKNIFNGNGLSGISLPVKIFGKHTQLQTIANFFKGLGLIHKAVDS